VRREGNVLTVTVIFCIIAVICCIGWVLFEHLGKSLGGDYEFDLDGEVNISEKLDMGEMSLVPGDSESYKVMLNSGEDGIYSISLEFLEELDGGLSRFVKVSAELDGIQVASGTLGELISSKDALKIQARIPGGKTAELTVTFSMPEDVGSEAMGSYSDLSMLIRLMSVRTGE